MEERQEDAKVSEQGMNRPEEEEERPGGGASGEQA